MANTAAKMTAAYLDSKGMGYEIVGNDDDVIRTGFKMDNMDSIRIFVIFDDDNASCSIKTFDYVKIPKEKYDKMYRVLNQMNRGYRWIKFSLDEEEGYIVISDDAVIQLDTCGEEVFRCMQQLAGIADDAYPRIQKELWSE